VTTVLLAIIGNPYGTADIRPFKTASVSYDSEKLAINMANMCLLHFPTNVTVN
jgi:hypothetical protein